MNCRGQSGSERREWRLKPSLGKSALEEKGAPAPRDFFPVSVLDSQFYSGHRALSGYALLSAAARR